ncbi:thyrotropin-releasing hormone receptor-like [Tubulanus polymorphus]|uniref:thyrotropin-releasing hormone receptor-like n=1 Tax=Tubulanus polymorphus TaxID=672921 RepID=UPI003DA56B11
MCKFLPYLECSVVNASIQTIIAISLDRFYAICKPLKAHCTSTFRRTLKILSVIWVVSQLLAVPFFFIADYKNSTFVDGTPIKVCRLYMKTVSPRFYAVSLVVISYVMPLIVLVIVYGIISRNLVSQSSENPQTFVSATTLRARKQVIMMLIAIIVLFFLCHLPYRVLSLFLIFDKGALFRLEFIGYHATLYLVRLLFYFHSAVNPIVYNIMSTNFREAFSKALGLSCRKSRVDGHNVTSWGSQTNSHRYDSLKLEGIKSSSYKSKYPLRQILKSNRTITIDSYNSETSLKNETMDELQPLAPEVITTSSI